MDRAVLRAYEWDDLAEQATCEFLLDYEEEEDTEDAPAGRGSKRRKKKPWRYRWPDEFRDEVLARLLELNEQRALEEKLAGETAAKAEEKKAAKLKRRTKQAAASTRDVFQDEELTDNDRMALSVIAAWGDQTWVDRLLFGQALLLWKNTKHRRYMLGSGEEPQRKPASVGSIPQIIGRIINQGWVQQRESEGIQWLCLSQMPSPVGNLSNNELKKVEEIRGVVKRIRESDDGIIEQTENSIRATKEFVYS